MPLYDVVCSVGHKFERMLKMSDRNNPMTCAQCGKPAAIQVSAVRSVLDGTDPSLPGAYLSWERRHSKHL